jgi:hypothetical protein
MSDELPKLLTISLIGAFREGDDILTGSVTPRLIREYATLMAANDGNDMAVEYIKGRA